MPSGPRSQRRGRHHTSAIFRAYSLSVCPRQSDCASSRCGSQPPGLRLRQKSCQPGAAPMRRAESLTPHGLDSLPPPAPGAARHSNRTTPSWWYHRAKPAKHARHRAGLHRGWFRPDTNGKPFALSQTRVGSSAERHRFREKPSVRRPSGSAASGGWAPTEKSKSPVSDRDQ